jgi:hypothetical protein
MKPSPELLKEIVAYIRAGAYPHVAAQAAGLSQTQFTQWMQRGERAGSKGSHADFAKAIRQAEAQARITAEMEIRQNKPLDWLRNGPGRHSMQNVGWTGNVRGTSQAETAGDLLDSPAMQETISTILRALEDHPEAKRAIEQALTPPPQE